MTSRCLAMASAQRSRVRVCFPRPPQPVNVSSTSHCKRLFNSACVSSDFLSSLREVAPARSSTTSHSAGRPIRAPTRPATFSMLVAAIAAMSV
eukprot:CAMPEP_0172812302 /NCGR_PEP_ID=MMETSP1075-20121228/9957_1 /TAXON_ID=2916 /ORGANISM="Ceratium fusus, Strain PA161109" /LENGTH=92 /DNA_ID=CAMNT_0013651839 /DNA_START=30 /DNA_END=308 /DNA_ORIENTATION=+